MKPPKEDEKYMVLRTIYLPPLLDEQLREIAHCSNMSKNEVIRILLMEKISEWNQKFAKREIVLRRKE